jgi:hypothetical protein
MTNGHHLVGDNDVTDSRLIYAKLSIDEAALRGFKSTYLNLELKLTKMSVPVLLRLPCSLTALHGEPDAAFFLRFLQYCRLA